MRDANHELLLWGPRPVFAHLTLILGTESAFLWVESIFGIYSCPTDLNMSLTASGNFLEGSVPSGCAC
jgi:hypothetical protein